MDNQKPKILVVDDEPGVLFTMTSILEQEGYEVQGMAGGAAALEAIRQRYYDLVLTDLNMPQIDGLAVLGEVRKRSPNTVTVMITGYGSLDSAVEALQLGAYEYLLKPLDVADLKLAVGRSLERKRLSEIDTLYRVGRAITNSLDLETIAAEVAQAVRNVLGLANACLVSFERDRTPRGCGPELRRLLNERFLRDRLAAGTILTAAECGEAAGVLAQHTGIQSLVLVPGVANAQLACVLCADNGPDPYDFHPWAQRFLQGLASQAALAVQNAALVAELKSNNDELAAANEKLRELDALKSRFLSVATHELRTPLSIILGYNSMLAESLQDRLSEEEKKTLGESIASCERLIRLVNSMLDLNQIQAGKMQMNFARQDLRRVVNGVIALFQAAARKRDLRLAVELPPRLPRMYVDGERIQQVLINLVGNAVKFTPPKGLITVSVRHQAEHDLVEIAVRDTGIGIPEEDQARIFDEFAQIHRQAARRQREGSGLGLAIAKRIVEAHEGSIEVHSSPGNGSTFTFRLPVKGNPSGLTTAVSA
ncbi:MAG TPA: ATP-binding protein [Terriglobales bacterium]|jgi:signal transduction histidine kinase|nr:ATP-binding protein [Terriglobales bacterium]